jgi:hypothetical protein
MKYLLASEETASARERTDHSDATAETEHPTDEFTAVGDGEVMIIPPRLSSVIF